MAVTVVRTVSASQIGSLLTQASASTTYLTQASASTTYLTQASASVNYLSNSSASTNYLTQSSASTNYLTKSSASTSYAPIIPSTKTGFRNVIINGSFNVWQRGNFMSTDISTNGTFFADRWKKIGTSGTATALPNSLSVGELPSTESGLSRYVRWWQSSAPTVSQGIETRIEGVRTLNGKTATLSFYAKLNSGTFPFDIRYQQNFGTGGSSLFSPTQITSSIKDMDGNVVTAPTNTWKRYYVTFTVPSISGKIIGSSRDDWLGISFYSPSSGTWEFDIAGVQLEEGSFPTPFELIPVALELQLCQRYYERVQPTSITSANFGNTFASGGWDSTTRADCTWVYKVQKRVPATIAFGSVTYFRCLQHGVAWHQPTAATYSEYGETAARIGFTTSSGGSAGQAALFSINNVNGWIAADAEF